MIEMRYYIVEIKGADICNDMLTSSIPYIYIEYLNVYEGVIKCHRVAVFLVQNSISCFVRRQATCSLTKNGKKNKHKKHNLNPMLSIYP